MNRLQIDDRINLNDVLILSEIQAKTRYNIGRGVLLEAADEAGAVIRIGTRKRGYLREALDDYFKRKAE